METAVVAGSFCISREMCAEWPTCLGRIAIRVCDQKDTGIAGVGTLLDMGLATACSLIAITQSLCYGITFRVHVS